MLAKRYRIVGLLGRGGMGEVYRADDLKLGQPVALKFLPRAVERDRSRLDRFLNEVKVALRVTHPNVCRVYDIGDVEGQHYISMEYVDGEDLASLLRRIERLPQSKAVQIARQLCAGLAAAHGEGILHRDLKPANVMIDGRGRAKITDFGLAGLVGGVGGEEIRAGTPAYMAPEQLAGKEVTVRSDLYSLGLVLYELFTGKRAFEAASTAEARRLQEESTPTSPSSHVDGLDPAVERTILRCLEKDPESRPVSALAVAAALPGGDPLAAALAAGETPSPEVVAAAGPKGGLRPGVAAGCLAAVLVGLVVAAFLGPTTLYGRAGLVKSMDALEENARTIARDLGYTEPPADHSSWLLATYREYIYLGREDSPPADWAVASDPVDRMVWAYYRQSPQPLVPRSLTGRVSFNDPPRNRPGQIYIGMSAQGRLYYLLAMPHRARFTKAPSVEVDWLVPFRAADLNIDDFEPTTPTVMPTVCTEERRAWSGVLSHWGDMPVRIEAAACDGKVVYFELVVPWDPHWSAETLTGTSPGPKGTFLAFLVAGLSLLISLVVGAVLLALRNLRLGRGDRRGAMRLAAFVTGARLVHWLLTGHHVASLFDEVTLFMIALSGALALGGLVWVLYVALEPWVRRLWPEALVSWSRLLAGRFRDPLIGRDLLIGAVIGLAAHPLVRGIRLLAEHLDVFPPTYANAIFNVFGGGRHVPGQLIYVLNESLFMSLGFLILLLFCRMIFRRMWLAVSIGCLLLAGINSIQFADLAGRDATALGYVFGFAIGLSFVGVAFAVLVRLGLLATIACFASGNLVHYFPVTVDVSAPYFGAGLFGILVAAALAIYGYRISLAGRPLFEGDLRG